VLDDKRADGMLDAQGKGKELELGLSMVLHANFTALQTE
jgi:hypothetical protein